MTGQSIYLDYAATTPLDESIARHMTELISQPWANPASLHAAGRRALTLLEDAKDRIKTICLGPGSHGYALWQAWHVVISSGGTEANNLALRSLRGREDPLIVTATEHPSVLTPAQLDPGLSPWTQLLPVEPLTGLPNIDALEQLLSEQADRQRKPLVSIMIGNNETGVLADIPRISALCRRFQAKLHTDAVQAFGKVDVPALLPLVDALTISGHKLHGPVGVGAFVVRSSAKPQPMLYGGGQQLGIRPGTESVIMTSALAAACELAEARRSSGEIELVNALRLRFEQRLCLAVPAARIIAGQAPRLPHISAVAFPGWDRQALLMALDLAGIHCSSGSACASGSSQPSHVLTAMGLPADWVAGAIRFSFSHLTTETEICWAVERIANIFSKTK